MASDAPRSCLHCQSPVPADSARAQFCCAGCEAVYSLLKEQGLDRYYALAGSQVAPIADAPRDRSFAWLEPLLARAQASNGSLCELELDVQGIHCAACVWLMNELYQRQDGGAEIHVNPALGKVRLRWRRDRFDLTGFLRSVEAFGYLFGPSRKRADARSLDLPIRLGITAAITMNVMLFSVSFYFGLTPAEGELFALFTQLSAWLSAVVVLVGGWPFFRAAWQGIRRGVLHLDLPIALGIVLVYATSLVQIRDGRGDLAYFDTLNTFVTLMLVGRWLQQRIVDRNRRLLLEDDGADGLFVRRIEGDRLSTIPAARVRSGDELLVAPGDLVPTDAALLDAYARLSTAWITGESDVREEGAGAAIVAGACNEGATAIRVRALTDFDASPLVSLLRRSSDRPPAFARFWSVLARRWVVSVLAVSALGVLLWWPVSPDTALQVAAALLVVTCPCAIGIATPLAYELTQARLRRAGVFIRSGDLLDRLVRVRKVLFDKTGTLTLGKLELANRGAVAALDARVRDLAYDMVARSNHPVSRCLAEALEGQGARFSGVADVVEVPGKGLELRRGGETWRLGRPGWAARLDGALTVLSRDGELVATFELRESIRPDARHELRALQSAGYEAWLISGDAGDKVARAAEALGIPTAHALASQRPEDKAAAVARIDAGDSLYLGDGVNDSLAFERALCAGTPSVDRPVMPGKADFFLLGEGVAGVREALEAAKRLHTTVRRILGLALVYNVLAVAACLAGQMTPLRAAVAMPLSSLTVIALAVWSLNRSRSAGPQPRRAAPDEAPAPAGVALSPALSQRERVSRGPA